MPDDEHGLRTVATGVPADDDIPTARLRIKELSDILVVAVGHLPGVLQHPHHVSSHVEGARGHLPASIAGGNPSVEKPVSTSTDERQPEGLGIECVPVVLGGYCPFPASRGRSAHPPPWASTLA